MRRTVAFLGLAVLLAGCTSVPSGIGGGTSAEQKPDQLEVGTVECRIGNTPCSQVQATATSPDARLTLTINNYGDAPVDIRAGDSGNGRGIMVSKC
ncbi:MAG: hypothetical protein SVW02_04440, partial [Candidatus Nanohaloarchaea archaeon]|nr:hypothetical protein [Candidatus Nanohaloarchaea archaeon]